MSTQVYVLLSCSFRRGRHFLSSGWNPRTSHLFRYSRLGTPFPFVHIYAVSLTSLCLPPSCKSIFLSRTCDAGCSPVLLTCHTAGCLVVLFSEADTEYSFAGGPSRWRPRAFYASASDSVQMDKTRQKDLTRQYHSE